MIFDRANVKFFKKWWNNIDKRILYLSMIFLVFGCLFAFIASPVVATRIGIKYNTFIVKHCIFAIISVIIIFSLSFLNDEQIKKISIISFIVLLMLLISVFFVGVSNKGSKRWIHIASFSIQPSEILKPFFVVVISHLIAEFKKPYNYYFAAGVLFLIGMLLIKQPDLGLTILLIVIFIIEIFLTNINLKYFSITIGGFVIILLPTLYFLFPHFHYRVDKYFESAFYENNKSYQVEKSLNAYVNGGFAGKGILNGEVKNSIPDSHTDFIFSVIGEEMGGVFCIFIIIFYAYFSIISLVDIKNTDNNFKYLSVCGLSLMFILQSFINIGVSLNLLPTKGITLPLISYGGSSMIGTAISIGFIIALTKEKFGNIRNENTLYEAFKEK
ncbi:MAG: FtsW/RodA/SpoVE family cell cycle protein [Rickettsiales bacterium]|jgi:cell division protein FtsW|nr:FtsW/RodA/SpoVE family cell cycle protein [Rickettsiales bacterium]